MSRKQKWLFGVGGVVILVFWVGVFRVAHQVPWRRLGGFVRNGPEIMELNQRSDQLAAEGRYADAIPLMRRQLKLIEKYGGPDKREVARTKGMLGRLYLVTDQNDQARFMYADAVRIFRKIGETHSQDYADSLAGLGLAYVGKRDYARAEPLLRQYLDLTRKTSGEKSAKYADALYCFAKLYQSREETAKAEELLAQAMRIKKQVSGDRDPDYLQMLDDLTKLYVTAEQWRQAEPLCREQVKLVQQAYGTEDERYIRAVDRLVVCANQWKKPEEEVSRITELLRLYAKGRPCGSWRYIAMVNVLANRYVHAHRPQEAEKVFQDSVKLIVRKCGKHMAYCDILNVFAEFEIDTGRYAEAERLYRQSLAFQQDKMGSAVTLRGLGTLYQKMKQYQRAEKLILQAIELEKEKTGVNALLSTDLCQLADVYADAGQYAEAEHLYKQAIHLCETTGVVSVWVKISALREYASFLRKTKRLAEALKIEARVKALNDQAQTDQRNSSGGHSEMQKSR